jgi:hypothetical protein
MRKRTRTCRSCRYFDDDPASIEAQLPGITILGSAYGSVRGAAGICSATARFMEPIAADECPHFAPRDADEPG